MYYHAVEYLRDKLQNLHFHHTPMKAILCLKMNNVIKIKLTPTTANKYEGLEEARLVDNIIYKRHIHTKRILHEYLTLSEEKHWL